MKKVIGLGHQNKLSLEIRMITINELFVLSFLTCKMGELNLIVFPEPAEHQKSLWRLLKAQLPWAYLAPVGLEFLSIGPREYTFLEGPGLFPQYPSLPRSEDPTFGNYCTRKSFKIQFIPKCYDFHAVVRVAI